MGATRETRGLWRGMLAALIIAGSGAWLAPDPALAQTAQTATPAITVNGVPIPADFVEAEFRWIENPKSIVHPASAERAAASRREAVDRVVVWELVRQKLAAAGAIVSDAEVEVAIAADRQRIGDGFPKYLAAFGQDELSLERRKRNILNFKKFLESIAVRQQVSDGEIKEAFDKVGVYTSPERYRAEYLQVVSVDKTGKLMHKNLADVAAAARERLAGGSTMEDTAKAFASSQVITRVGGGAYDRGQGPLFEQACLALSPGQVSEVMKIAENAYIIVRLNERVPSKALSLEEAQPEIRRILQQSKADVAMREDVAALKAKAAIVYLDKKYDPDRK